MEKVTKKQRKPISTKTFIHVILECKMQKKKKKSLPIVTPEKLIHLNSDRPKKDMNLS